MANFELQDDEVILYTDDVTSSIVEGDIKLTLTSQKLVFEKEKGVFKKELELVEIVPLENVKFYNDAPQIKQKGSEVDIQTTGINFTIELSNIIEARKFTTKAIGAVTGTTISKRGAEKVKSAIELVDDVLQADTRGAVRGVFENGVKGTLLNGIGKKKI